METPTQLTKEDIQSAWKCIKDHFYNFELTASDIVAIDSLEGNSYFEKLEETFDISSLIQSSNGTIHDWMCSKYFRDTILIDAIKCLTDEKTPHCSYKDLVQYFIRKGKFAPDEVGGKKVHTSGTYTIGKIRYNCSCWNSSNFFEEVTE